MKMKHIKTYKKLFENIEIDLNKIKDLLIDFKHLGLEVSTSIQDCMVLDFSNGNIQSHKVADYFINKKECLKIIIIGVYTETFSINIDLLKEIYYDMLIPYLDSVGLSINYCFISDNYGFIYFKTIDDLIHWAKNNGFENGNIETRILNLSFINRGKIKKMFK